MGMHPSQTFYTLATTMPMHSAAVFMAPLRAQLDIRPVHQGRTLGFRVGVWS
jgi:hypothetical protein